MSNVKVLTESDFDKEVLLKDSIVMVKYGAMWCAPCKALKPILENVAAEATFKVFEVDIDDSPTLTKKYGVRGVPTILVFKDGQVVKTHAGLTSKEELLKMGQV